VYTKHKIIAGIGLGLLMSGPVNAAVICATSSAGLEFALAAAEGNGEHDEIRIASGTYSTINGGFRYFAESTENFDLTISGGWSEFFENPCGQQLEGSPNTTLNGQLSDRVLEVKMHDGGNLQISRIAFQNGFVPDPGRGAGLWIRTEVDFSGSIRLERNLFFNNEARWGGGLSMGIAGSDLGQVHVVNNLFRLNRARFNYGAVELLLNGGLDQLFGARTTFINNTVVNNLVETTESDSTGGILISGSVPSKYVINNNLWGNQGLDLRVAGLSSTFSLRNNNFENSAFNQAPTSEAGNISVVPLYEPCTGLLCFNGVPHPESELFDGGLEPGMISAWSTGSFDYRGLPRSNDESIDIGAFESHARVFADRFEP